MAKKWKETDLAQPVVDWFLERGFEVYQEVQIAKASWIIDIVATQRSLVWGVELKTTRSLSVLEQGWEKFAHCHRVSCAVPRQKERGRSRGMLWNKIRRDLGIGMFEISGDRCTCDDWPGTRSRAPCATTLRDALRPEHKTFATAGGADGRRWSPWRDTLQKLTHYVRGHEGCTVKDAIKGMDGHHYSSDQSAYSSLLYCLNWQPDALPEIEVRHLDGRTKRLYMKEVGSGRESS